ncbi:MAG: secretin N-terminal domain-containing protein [Planctomycetaceae bacterium]
MVSPRKLFGPCCVVAALVVAFGLESISGSYVQAQDFKGRRRREGMVLPTPTIIVQPAEAPKTEAKKEENKDDKAGDKKPPVETVKRPDKPEGKANPEELKALKPDKDGKIRFNFKGQQWVDVLNWLADISEMQLDWQEVPGKTVDLTTRQSYTIDEARDTINRMLRDRGFTLVRKDEVLSVVNLASLDPGVLPRVQPEELKDRDANEFVKVSFQLDTLLAEKAVEELKPMCSPHGKLTALKTTNRLEAVDAVANLREIYRLLEQEQSQTGQERLLANFPLKYTRAADIKTKIEALLGVEKKSQGPMTPEQMQQMQQQAQMRMQQQAQGAKPPGGDDKQAQVFIVANERDNSIMVNGPADKIAIVRQAVALLDQPLERTDFASKLQSFRVYRLSGLDPEAFVQILQQTARLDPTTQLEVDKLNNAVFASASPIDHGKIKMLVDTLDGSGRRFKVIRLRRLPADYLAGTLQHMINGDEDEDKNSSRRRSYGYWGDYGRSQTTQKQDKFRVEGDVEGNRLLLWANDVEEKLVDDFLVEMGELPPPGGNRDTVRRIEISPGRQTEELLERLQRAWPSIAPNELKIAPAPAPEASDEAKEKAVEPIQAAPTRDTRAEVGPRNGATTGPRNPVAAARDSVSPFLQLAQLEQPAGETPAKEEAAQPEQQPAPAEGDSPPAQQPPVTERLQQPPEEEFPPRDKAPEHGAITITRSPKGGLIIESKDPRALDLLEEVIAELAPQQEEFKYYPLKHADCFWISSKLEDYFKEDDKDKKTNNWDSWYWGNSSNDQQEKPNRLSRRKPLKFIWEDETNSIIVQGGDPSQLATVEKLIKLWDQPQPKNTESARKWKNFHVKYSKAKVVAETIKEVYRDLLSETDKALQSNNNQKDKDKKGVSERPIYTYIDAGGEGDRKTPVRFKGLLSVGIDDLSNTLIVSAPDWLMKDVEQMIDHLDAAARPSSTVQVLQVDRRINSAMLQKKLAEVFGKRAAPGQGQEKPGEQKGQQPGQNAGEGGNSNGGRNRGGGDAQK